MQKYEDAVAYVESLITLDRKRDKEAGIARMEALLKELDNPEKSFPTVHIGGTAGKGSTSMITAQILADSGYKTGLHISPHLLDMRERAQVNGKLMSKEQFVELVDYIKPFVDKVKQKYPYGYPSFFEILIAVTFEHFRREKVQIAVVEVGMGGKYDGTNVITPYVAILTNVGLDHMEYLGNTVEKIAKEKVGIFKEGIDVISGVEKPSVVKIVKDEAKRLNCNLSLLGKQITYKITEYGEEAMRFDLQIDGDRYSDIKLTALGEHQVANCSLAIAAITKLRKHGFKINDEKIYKTTQKIRLPGRFDVINKKPTIILDGAHNPMKMKALVSILKHNYKKRKILSVFAAKRGKDVGKMLKNLRQVSNTFYVSPFEATTDFGKRMSYEPKELKKFFDKKAKVMLFNDSESAYRSALLDAEAKDVVCVTGSLYLVGEILGKIKEQQDLSREFI